MREPRAPRDAFLFLLGAGALGALIACAASCGSSAYTTPPASADAGDAAVAPIQGGSEDAGSDASAPLAITAPTTPVVLVAGSTVDVPFTRSGDANEAIAVTLTGLPSGVTASALTIAAQATAGKITLNATVSTKPASVTITASAAGTTHSTQTTFALQVEGAPGTADTSFGTSGLASVGETSATATGVGVQKNGSVVIGGSAGLAFVVARFTSAGALDSTFGTQGLVETTISDTMAVNSTTAITIDANDRIMHAGALTYSASPDTAEIFRYGKDGALDAAFGTAGIQEVAEQQDTYALAYDATGNPLFGGYDLINAGRLFRLTPTGPVDDTFGQPPDGYAELHINATIYVPRALGVQSSGSIIAVGDNFLARVTSAGAIDTTFATNGFYAPSAYFHDWRATRIATDDSIFVAGIGAASTTTTFSISKLTKDGTLDTTFNGTGTLDLTLGDANQSAEALGMAIQKDGKLVVVGSATSGGRAVMAIVRVTSAGALDATFGDSGGIVLAPFGTTDSMANAVALQSDGRILVAGEADGDLVVARFWP